MGGSCFFFCCQSVCASAALVDRDYIKCIYPPCSCSSCPSPPAEFSRESLLEAQGGLECPLLSKEKEERSNAAGAADPSPSSPSSSSSQQQQRTNAGTPESKGALARTHRPLFRRGKSFRALGRLFLPSWDPGEHLQRRFDPGFIEQKSQGEAAPCERAESGFFARRVEGAEQILRLLRLRALLHSGSFEAGCNAELRLPVTKRFSDKPGSMSVHCRWIYK